MTKPRQSNNSGTPKKQVEKTKLPVIPENISVPNDEHANKREDNANTHQEIVIPNDKSNRNARIANSIAGMALVISAILAWYTFKVFEIASSQKDSVKKSADASMLSAQTAQNTLIESKRYNDLYIQSQIDAFNESKRYNNGSLSMQQKTFESNNKDSRERFMRDTSALGLQIKSLKQSQDQFLKQNEPYLQVYIDSLYFVGNRVRVVYTLVNITSIPVKIISEKTDIRFSPIEPIIKDKDLQPSADINYYVIKESPQTRTITPMDSLSINERKWITEGSNFTYWKAVFDFQNLISGKIKKYSFYVKLTKLKDRRTYADFISNDNYVEK